MEDSEFLPVEIATSAYRFVFDNIGTFFAAALPFIILLTGFSIYSTVEGMRGLLTTLPLQVIIEAMFALLWHRFYLLGRMNRFWWYGLGLSNTKNSLRTHRSMIKKFVLWSIWYQIAFLIPYAIISTILAKAIPEVVIAGVSFAVVGGIVIVTPLLFRYLPFFPAVAIGNLSVRMADTYDLTRGYTFKIWAAFMTSLIPIVVLNIALPVPGDILTGVVLDVSNLELFARSAATATTSLLLMALGATTNSEIFRLLSGWTAPEAAEAT